MLMKTWIQAHALWSYFILAYGLAWGIGSPVLFLGLTWQEAPLLAIGAAFGPLFAAVIVSAVLGGRTAVGDLLGRYLRWRAHWLAFLLAFLPFMLGTAVALVYALLGGPRPEPPPFPDLGALLAQIPFILLVGPFSEEAGWRGFALPRLQARYNALHSTLILSVFWWLWHFPLWFVGGGRGSLLNFGLFLVHIVCISIFLTAIYNLSNGSLLLVVLGHFCANFGSIGFGLIPPDAFYLWATPVWLVATIVLIARLKPSCLTGSWIDATEKKQL